MAHSTTRTGTQVGVISDTHGLLRPEAIAALQQSALILHAGDIGNPQVLEVLKTIAPVVAVRGNNDKGDWAETIPDRETVMVENVSVHMLHILKEFKPEHPPVQVVISGHSHKPMVEQRDGILFLNPGSAGPRRFKLPVSIALLHIDRTDATAEIVELVV